MKAPRPSKCEVFSSPPFRHFLRAEQVREMKNAARGGVRFRDVGGLDADAELRGLLIAGARVEVVGRALIELVA